MRRSLVVLTLAALMPVGSAAAAQQQFCSGTAFSISGGPNAQSFCAMDLEPGEREMNLVWSPEATGHAYIWVTDDFSYVAWVRCLVHAGLIDECEARGVESFHVEASPVDGGAVHAVFMHDAPLRSILEVRTVHVACANACPGAMQGTFSVLTQLR